MKRASSARTQFALPSSSSGLNRLTVRPRGVFSQNHIFELFFSVSFKNWRFSAGICVAAVLKPGDSGSVGKGVFTQEPGF
jgi:hypothetical protein